MRFWLDGAAVDSLTVMNAGCGLREPADDLQWTAPTFDRLDLGWESYQQDTRAHDLDRRRRRVEDQGRLPEPLAIATRR